MTSAVAGRLGAAAAAALLGLAMLHGAATVAFAADPGDAAAAGAAASERIDTRARHRPLQAGTSIGMARGGVGTLCCFGRDAQGRSYLISADHILGGPVGGDVVQPGLPDGGQAEADVVATLTRVERPQPTGKNQKIGSIARLRDGVAVDPVLPGIGRLTGIATGLELGGKVRMLGRTSGLVEGEILAYRDATLKNGGGGLPLTDVVVTTKLGIGGDSGAPVVNEKNELIGMIFASSDKVSVVVPIRPFLDAVGLQLVTEP